MHYLAPFKDSLYSLALPLLIMDYTPFFCMSGRFGWKLVFLNNIAILDLCSLFTCGCHRFYVTIFSFFVCNSLGPWNLSPLHHVATEVLFFLGGGGLFFFLHFFPFLRDFPSVCITCGKPMAGQRLSSNTLTR